MQERKGNHLVLVEIWTIILNAMKCTSHLCYESSSTLSYDDVDKMVLQPSKDKELASKAAALVTKLERGWKSSFDRNALEAGQSLIDALWSAWEKSARLIGDDSKFDDRVGKYVDDCPLLWCELTSLCRLILHAHLPN